MCGKLGLEESRLSLVDRQGFEGVKFLGGEERVCDAICQEWYPLLREEIFCLEVF